MTDKHPSSRNNAVSGLYVGKHAAIRYVQASQITYVNMYTAEYVMSAAGLWKKNPTNRRIEVSKPLKAMLAQSTKVYGGHTCCLSRT